MRKMLISDFDHTFFTSNGLINNIAAVKNFMDKNNVFVIASGRHTQSLIKDIKSYDIPFNYLICNDGGIILDNNYNIIYQNDIPINEVPLICELFNNKYIIDWYIDTGLTLNKNKNSPANGIIGKIDNVPYGKKLLSLIVNKCPSVHGYVTEKRVNITSKEVSKDNGIKIINNIEKIDIKNIYTIGNNINDISMSHYNSACMINSSIELIKLCKIKYKEVYFFINDIMLIDNKE
ncbi:MAG: HAD hydrolase family protein [Bacilli bacterium]|nr:HAD hydrolase family protein [Bacilli bacterium]